MTNPPFGKKSSITFTNEDNEQEEEDLVCNRQDFRTKNSNKQLNFVQYINTILKATGNSADFSGFVDKILVHQTQKTDDGKVQTIEIYFKGVGVLN